MNSSYGFVIVIANGQVALFVQVYLSFNLNTIFACT